MGLNRGGMRTIHPTPPNVHAGAPRTGPNHPSDLRAPHLGLVSLWTQLKDAGQPLRPKEQSQSQGSRVSVLRRILADVPLWSAEKLSLTQESFTLDWKPTC